MSYAYLGSPYTHEDPFVMEQRYIQAGRVLSRLLHHKIWTYSPIVHCHELAKIGGLPKDAAFWREYDFFMLSNASKMYVLCGEGYDTSKGLAAEIVEAKRIKIPVEYI